MNRIGIIVAVLIVAGGAFFLASRSDEGGSGGGRPDPRAGKSGGGRAGQGGSGANGQDGGGSGGGSSRPVLPESTCPPDLSDCVVASGRVIYVEAVDPDGDGDAHFVTTSDEGITFPGLTVFDVRVDLRPEPLPEVGDLVGGAGPVFRGSSGQKQIEVVEFHVAR